MYILALRFTSLGVSHLSRVFCTSHCPLSYLSKHLGCSLLQELLSCERQLGNPHDPSAVAVKKGGSYSSWPVIRMTKIVQYSGHVYSQQKY